ncbi:unnamed protein product [Pseudo-nitzschia multistriata]|uniref:Uncharacterized protein n=1 Tax=Pseudo-nitzschia multistriata TaxID=183589 RepID=A0A448ZGW7_9STRA|nr:unnamed protein product [Pseudo-nitzschia multistriata]
MMGQTAAIALMLVKTCLSFRHCTFPALPSLGLRVEDRGSLNPLFYSNQNGDDPQEDWRDIRAKLVMQYDKGNDHTTTNRSNTTCMPPIPGMNRWAYDSGDVIEVGSLIVSHPYQDWGGLKKQHFHKCIILVIEHSQDGTKGIILNRKLQDEQHKNWICHFGGDTEGIGSSDGSLGCLFRLNDLSRVKIGMALSILNDIAIMPLDIAQCLVDEEEAKKEDFRLYHGYSAWGPGQLEKQIKRGDWFMVATDTESLWDIIVQESTFSTGTDKWVQMMKRIGKESLMISSPNQKFEDDMLKQYMRLRLLKKSSNELQRSKSSRQQMHARKKSACNLSPGTLVRSSTTILFDEQVFHQSLVLILQDNPEMTIGVVLNRPHSTSVSIGGTSLPLRYGGRFELDDEGIPELWFHCNNEILQEARIGEPVSQEGKARSIFWKCTRKDAETAIKTGLGRAEDFLVVSGLSVWEKEELTKHAGETSCIKLDDCFSKVDENSIDTIWKLLMVQEPLNKRNAAENLEAANTAWMLSGDAGWMLSGGSKQFNSRVSSDFDKKEQQVVQSLAYSALDRWIRTYLLKH